MQGGGHRCTWTGQLGEVAGSKQRDAGSPTGLLQCVYLSFFSLVSRNDKIKVGFLDDAQKLKIYLLKILRWGQLYPSISICLLMCAF